MLALAEMGEDEASIEACVGRSCPSASGSSATIATSGGSWTVMLRNNSRPARRKPQCDRPAEGTARHVGGRGAEPLDQGLEVVLVLSAGALSRPRFALAVTPAVVGDHPERRPKIGLDRELPRRVVAPRTVDEDERVALPTTWW